MVGAETLAPAKEEGQKELAQEAKGAEDPSPAKSLFKLFAPGDDDEKRRLRAEVSNYFFCDLLLRTAACRCMLLLAPGCDDRKRPIAPGRDSESRSYP